MGKLKKEIKTPEEEELETKGTELEKLLETVADRELELANLQTSILNFEHKYYSEVGSRYVKLDQLNAKITEKLAKRKPHDANAQKEKEKAYEAASKSAEEYSFWQGKDEGFEVGKEPSEEIKALYRKVAKEIHPDKATDEKEVKRRTKLMAELNSAYACGNVEKIKQILKEWKSSPESITGEGVVADLVRTIRSIAQIKDRLEAIDEEMETVKSSDIYQLFTKVQQATAKGIDLLAELAKKLDENIRLAEAKLQSLS